jgi:hypothetical protein
MVDKKCHGNELDIDEWVRDDDERTPLLNYPPTFSL